MKIRPVGVLVFTGFVLLILNVLLPRTSAWPGRLAGSVKTKFDISKLTQGLHRFRRDIGRLPTTQEGLLALVECPDTVTVDQWQGPYLPHGIVPEDPWRSSFIYRCPGVRFAESFDLYSLGPDRQSVSEGSDSDDIANWRIARFFVPRYRVSRWFTRIIDELRVPMNCVVVLIGGTVALLLRRRQKRRLTSV